MKVYILRKLLHNPTLEIHYTSIEQAMESVSLEVEWTKADFQSKWFGVNKNKSIVLYVINEENVLGVMK